MDIDITGDPPSDVGSRKKRYIGICMALLGAVLLAVLLGGIRVVFDSGYDGLLENIALIGFVGAGFAFVYFAEKLMGYKSLSGAQRNRIEEICRLHRDIDLYRRKVERMNRGLVAAEYDAIIAHLDAIEGRKKRR